MGSEALFGPTTGLGLFAASDCSSASSPNKAPSEIIAELSSSEEVDASDMEERSEVSEKGENDSFLGSAGACWGGLWVVFLAMAAAVVVVWGPKDIVIEGERG